ncbi:MAG: hypothetical protein ACK5KP_12110 [Paludibacteraceae bacterium]
MFKYFVSILFCWFVYSGLPATVNTDDQALLLRLDKMIKHRDEYRLKVEREIADVNRTLFYADNDKSRFDLLGTLFTKYRSFRIDSAMIIAKERLRLAEILGDENLINQGLMNVADAMNKMGKYENALLTLDSVKRTEEVKKDTYFYYLYHTVYSSFYNDVIDDSEKQIAWQKMKVYRNTLVAVSDPSSSS